ncbi:MAG: response regulator [Candidatus Omnitrophica bacterium]|nr:response regulator [Candidatus Omnitrophota bacterium]
MVEKYRILIVDDDKLVRWSLIEVLNKNGYEATSTETGEEAINKIEDARFDLVITDLRLPGIGGFEVLNRVKEINPSTKVIMITAYGSEGVANEAREKGAELFVNKPFEINRIREEVKEILLKGGD